MFWSSLSAGTPGAALGIFGLGLNMVSNSIKDASYREIYMSLTEERMVRFMNQWRSPGAGGPGVPDDFHKFHPATYAQEIVDYNFWSMSARNQRGYLSVKTNPRPTVNKWQAQWLRCAKAYTLYRKHDRMPWKAQAALDSYNKKLEYWQRQYELSLAK